MGRPREFDVDAALDRALAVLWAKGYESASLDDLCDATGLGRSSLYAAFGDKRALYLRALERYEEAAAQRINDALAQPVPVREAIAGFLGRLIDDIVAGPGRRGCFIGNCAAELARGDRETAAHVRRSLARIETAFRDALARAQARGEIDDDARALARFLTSGIQGLRLVGKANPDRAVLDDIAQVMLRCLGR
jgi:TetR/AcrR family transcriptional regulator, transcriptional repressor for nem operon